MSFFARTLSSSTAALVAPLCAALLLVACSSDDRNAAAPAAMHTLGGSVAGLTGTVVLRNNGGNDLAVTTNGGFVFAAPLASGTAYDVTVATQPADQSCVVSNGTGSIGNANITSVAVACTVNPLVPVWTVGGNVTGLNGTVKLRNNNADEITVTASGSFTFPAGVNNGGNYQVTVSAQPAGQTCTVSTGSGAISGADITSVAVDCVSATYTIGGTVSGLVGALTLQNNGGDDLALAADGTFQFATPIAHGSNYNVTVLSKPAGQTCVVINGSGPVTAHVTAVNVTCFTSVFSIGGTISGLSGTVVLQNNLVNNLSRSTNGAFTFPAKVSYNGGYSVGIATQPAGQNCAVSNASGVAVANVTDIAVTCTNLAYTINVTVSGISDSLTLQNNGGDDLVLTADGATSFPTQIAHDSDWNVTILSAPTGRVCSVINATGTIVASDIYVLVGCTDTAPPTTRMLLDTVTRPQEVSFVWNPVVGATWYELFRSFEGDANWPVTPFLTVAQNPAGTTNNAADILPVHLQDWPNVRYRMSACNIFGCSTPATALTVTARVPDLIGYFKPENIDAGDLLGSSVALSGDGNTLAIGAPCESGDGSDAANNGYTCAGAVYVYHRDIDGDWIQAAYLKASNPGAYDYFGTRLALAGDGNTLVVAATGEDSNATGIGGNQADNSASGAGAVYVFTRVADTWSQEAYIKASNSQAQDLFGSSVALATDGNTLAVGAVGEDSGDTGIGGDETNEGQADAGAVYVFTRSGAAWTQQAYVKASNTYTRDGFGTAVALSASGDTLVVGAPGEDSDATGINNSQGDNIATAGSGAAYVYVRVADAWSQQAYVKASNTGKNDLFGRAVALSGDGTRLAVGAVGEASNALGIDGNEADNSMPSSGAVYLFGWDTVAWSQQAYVKASNTGSYDEFGDALAFSADGNMLAVGAAKEAGAGTGLTADQTNNAAVGAGAVYLFNWDTVAWSQKAYVKASNSEAEDGFGRSIALSSDGSRMAVGAEREDSAAFDTTVSNTTLRNDNSAPQSGVVYLY